MATKTPKTPEVGGITKRGVRVSFRRKTGETVYGKTTAPAVKEANGHWIMVKQDDGKVSRQRPTQLTAA